MDKICELSPTTSARLEATKARSALLRPSKTRQRSCTNLSSPIAQHPATPERLSLVDDRLSFDDRRLSRAMTVGAQSAPVSPVLPRSPSMYSINPMSSAPQLHADVHEMDGISNITIPAPPPRIMRLSELIVRPPIR